MISQTTKLYVAQRISTVLTADKILVLDDGQIAATGDHRTLLATSAIYREIYASQLEPELLPARMRTLAGEVAPAALATAASDGDAAANGAGAEEAAYGE